MVSRTPSWTVFLRFENLRARRCSRAIRTRDGTTKTLFRTRGRNLSRPYRTRFRRGEPCVRPFLEMQSQHLLPRFWFRNTVQHSVFTPREFACESDPARQVRFVTKKRSRPSGAFCDQEGACLGSRTVRLSHTGPLAKVSLENGFTRGQPQGLPYTSLEMCLTTFARNLLIWCRVHSRE
jgi:hypothetical protein